MILLIINFIFIAGAKYFIILPALIVGFYLFKAPPEIRRKLLIFLAISLPLTYLVGLAAGALHFNPRPFVVGGFTPLIAHAADNGFPSDHVLLAAALASAILYFNRKYAWWLWGIAAFIALSRVYVGVHHFLDVAASAVIAILCAIIANKIYGRK